jgi:hypothetical protein
VQCILTFREPIINYADVEVITRATSRQEVFTISLIADVDEPLGQRTWIDNAISNFNSDFSNHFPYVGRLGGIALQVLDLAGDPTHGIEIVGINFTRKPTKIVKATDATKVVGTFPAGWVLNGSTNSWTKNLTLADSVSIGFTPAAGYYAYMAVSLTPFGTYNYYVFRYYSNFIKTTVPNVEVYWDTTNVVEPNPETLTFSVDAGQFVTASVTLQSAHFPQIPSAFGYAVAQVAAQPGAQLQNLGSAAYHQDTEYLKVANNLSEAFDKAAARANLGLGTFAPLNVAGAVLAGVVSLTAQNLTATTGIAYPTLGNVSRDLASCMAERAISVKDFGASGNGVVDDGIAIQAAANFAATNNYQLLFPRPSVYYRILTYISIPSNSDWVGEDGAILYLDPAMTLSGVSIGGGTCAIYSQNTTNVTLTGITFQSTNVGAMVSTRTVFGTVTDLRLDRCNWINIGRFTSLTYNTQTANFTIGKRVTGSTSGAFGTIMADADAGATGTLTLGAVTGTFIAAETITDGVGGSAKVGVETVGVYTVGVTVYNSTRVGFLNCKALNCSGGGFAADSSTDVKFIGCISEGGGDAGITLTDAINEAVVSNCILRNNSPDGITIDRTQNLSVTNNIIHGYNRGIRIARFAGGFSQKTVTLTGNVIQGMSQWGISLETMDADAVYNISANVIRDCFRGVYVIDTQNGAISGNTFYNITDAAILLESQSGTCGEATISGNFVNTAAYGMRQLQTGGTSSEITLSGNRFTNCTNTVIAINAEGVTLTCVPGISFGGTPAGGYTSQIASYVLRDGWVDIQGLVILSAVGAGVGAAQITGLPKAVRNNIDTRSAAALLGANFTYTGVFAAAPDPGATTFSLYQISAAGALSSLTNANFTNTAQLNFSLRYRYK